MLSINTNLSSLIAQRSMTQSTNSLNLTIERMTTGFKINHSRDNAANYSIATNMDTKIGSYEVAEDNTSMALDLLTTASDSLALIQDRIQRLRDLQEQASNGTYGEQSLRAINEECCALVDEITRVYETTEFNGLSLFLEPTEMPDGTKVVLKESDAQLTTTFKELGITSTAFEIYDSDDNIIQAYDLEEEDTIQDFFDTLQTHGFTTNLRNGVISIESTSLMYLEGDLVDELGIQTKNKLNVSYTTETETIWTTTTTETTQTNTIYSTTTSTTTQTNTVFVTTTVETTSVVTTETVTTNHVMQTGTLTVAATANVDVEPYAVNGNFIQEVTRRDTSTITALSSMNSTSPLAGGTYKITTTQELVQLSAMSNAGLLAYEYYGDSHGYTFVLGANIDLASVADWTPISGYYIGMSFDGNGYVISNLTSTTGGLIGSTSYGFDVSNLGIENANIQTNNPQVGIICGDHVEINNCYTTGYISGEDVVGGLSGFYSEIKDSYSTATVVGKNYVGGLVGDYAYNINNSYFSGNVTGVSNVGGLVGDATGDLENYTFDNSYCSGNVSGNSNVGGLFGSAAVPIVNECFFSGNITGNQNIGGLIGFAVPEGLLADNAQIINSSVLTSSTDLDGVFVGNIESDSDSWGIPRSIEITDSTYNSFYDDIGTPLFTGETPIISNVVPVNTSPTPPPAVDTTVSADTTFSELGLADFQVTNSSGSILVNVTGSMTMEQFIAQINSRTGYNAELLNGVLVINSLEEIFGLESLNPQKSSTTSTTTTTSTQTIPIENVTETLTTQTVTTTTTTSVVETQTLLVTTTNSTTNTTTLWSTSTVATTQTTDKQTYKAVMENVYAPGTVDFLVGINADQEQNLSVKLSFKLDDISGLKGIGTDDYDYLSQIDTLQEKLSEQQVYYGAMQNRLMSVLDEISITRDNLISSRSTLRDADIAEVSSQYIQQQILQQASATLMATANQAPAIALQLI